MNHLPRKSPLLRTAALLLLCGSALSACVQALWSVSYSVEGADSTMAHFITPGPGDAVLLAGYISLPGDPQTFLPQGTAYVAQYSGRGQLDWRYTPDDQSSFAGVTSLDRAPDGSLYFSDIRVQDTVLTRLDANGQKIWEYRRPQKEDLFNPELALRVKVVNDNLILLGLTEQYGSAATPPGTLLALDGAGTLLWQFHGIGSGPYDPAVMFDIEVLPDQRIATFHSFSALDEQGRTGGAILLLDGSGLPLVSMDQDSLGLTRILDLAPLGNQLVVAGSTAAGSRLLLLDESLNVLQQRDFPAASAARLATQNDTVCFALLAASDPEASVTADAGITTFGIIDRHGQRSWETTTTDYHSQYASLSVDKHRCAFTDTKLNPGAGVLDTPDASSRTVLYSASGVQETIEVAGSTGIANFGHSLLRGRSLYTATTVMPPEDSPTFEPVRAVLYKHGLY